MSAADTQPPRPAHHLSRLLLNTCGATILLGCLASIASNIIGSVIVPNYSFVADTISDLGAGRYETLQDVGMFGFAAALVAGAIAAAHLPPRDTKWSLGVLLLAVLAALVIIIAARNEYGDHDREGVVIHRYLVAGLALLFPCVGFLFRQSLGELRNGYGTVSVVCAIAWIVSAPIFLIIPTGYDGLWERILALIMIIWLALLARIIFALAAQEANA